MTGSQPEQRYVANALNAEHGAGTPTTADPAAYLRMALTAYSKAQYHRAGAAALIGLLGHALKSQLAAERYVADGRGEGPGSCV